MSIEAVNQFEHLVNNITDPDFGDFKRKTGNYIARLSSDLIEHKEAFSVLAKLKADLIYGDNLRNTDHAREVVQEYIDNLKETLES